MKGRRINKEEQSEERERGIGRKVPALRYAFGLMAILQG